MVLDFSSLHGFLTLRVLPVGIEPTTAPLGGGCYIHLTMRAKSGLCSISRRFLFYPVITDIFSKHRLYLISPKEGLSRCGTEVAIGSSLGIDWFSEVEHLDDAGRTQIEVLGNDVD